MIIKLDERHTIVEAKAIFDNKEIELKAKPQSNTGVARCHFLPALQHGDFTIQLRLDWKDLTNEGDPTLDADITKNGQMVKNKEEWHHTTRKLQDDLYLYTWEPKIAGLEGVRVSFKLQTTHQHTLQGTSTIGAPVLPNLPKN